MRDTAFLNNLVRTLAAANISTIPRLSKFIATWNDILSNNNTNFKAMPVSGEVFPLEHIFQNTTYTVFINVEAIKLLFKQNQLIFQYISSYERNMYYYTEMNETKLLSRSFDTPVFGLHMVSWLDGDYRKPIGFAIIDGNHRVSAANHEGIEIPICCLKYNYAPPVFFKTEHDWLMYHILESYYLTTSLYNDMTIDVYLRDLQNFICG